MTVSFKLIYTVDGVSFYSSNIDMVFVVITFKILSRGGNVMKVGLLM